MADEQPKPLIQLTEAEKRAAVQAEFAKRQPITRKVTKDDAKWMRNQK